MQSLKNETCLRSFGCATASMFLFTACETFRALVFLAVVELWLSSSCIPWCTHCCQFFSSSHEDEHQTPTRARTVQSLVATHMEHSRWTITTSTLFLGRFIYSSSWRIWSCSFHFSKSQITWTSSCAFLSPGAIPFIRFLAVRAEYPFYGSKFSLQKFQENVKNVWYNIWYILYSLAGTTAR